MVWLTAFLLVLLLAPPCSGAKPLLLLSWNLRPYWEFVDGFREKTEAHVLVLGEGPVDLSRSALVLALGHRALSFALAQGRAPVVAALVVAPELVPASPRLLGGIYLRLPPEEFLPVLRQWLRHRLGPSFTVGLPYTSPENARFAQEAARCAVLWGLKVKPLPLRRGLQDLDLRGVEVVYFVPDPFLETEETVEQALERVLLAGRVAVGYNRFFLRRGAQLALAVDYQEAGRLAAALLKRAPGPIGWHPAPFKVLEAGARSALP